MTDSSSLAGRRPVLRFAPSPNGYLHLGHAYSALMNEAKARRCAGQLLLRLEDLDRERCTQAYALAIVEDLVWLGVKPSGPVLRQSDHRSAYAAALDRLAARGLVYPCFCTRGAIRSAIAARRGWPTDPDGVPLYPGTCRQLTPGERTRLLDSGRPASLRLDLAAALAQCREPLHWEEYGEGDAPRVVLASPEVWGDPVLGRRDIGASYHVAVVVDDARQAVTDVVRGSDLFDATGLHRLLQGLLGLPPPRYHHHRIVLGEDGKKLSKSRAAPSLRSLRSAGATPADIRDLVVAGDRLGPREF